MVLDDITNTCLQSNKHVYPWNNDRRHFLSSPGSNPRVSDQNTLKVVIVWHTEDRDVNNLHLLECRHLYMSVFVVRIKHIQRKTDTAEAESVTTSTINLWTWKQLPWCYWDSWVLYLIIWLQITDATFSRLIFRIRSMAWNFFGLTLTCYVFVSSELWQKLCDWLVNPVTGNVTMKFQKASPRVITTPCIYRRWRPLPSFWRVLQLVAASKPSGQRQRHFPLTRALYPPLAQWPLQWSVVHNVYCLY